VNTRAPIVRLNRRPYVLYCYLRDRGETFTSNTVAQYMGVSEWTAREHIGTLMTHGLCEVIEEAAGRMFAVYRIIPAEVGLRSQEGRVWEYLCEQYEPVTAREIAEGMGRNARDIGVTLRRLRNAGWVQSLGIPDTPGAVHPVYVAMEVTL